MELNKHHREALLNESTKAKEDLQTQSAYLNQLMKDAPKDCMVNWFEIGEYLAQQRIKLIEQALINNNIDY